MRFANIKKLLLVTAIVSSCEAWHRKLAEKPAWVPKYSYELVPSEKSSALLQEKTPLDLNISFDSEWNANNDPQKSDGKIAEDGLDFLVKSIDTKKGKLYYRHGDNIGKEFVANTKLKHGSTKLYYVPEKGAIDAIHTISTQGILLTLNFGVEVGSPQSTSLNLDVPAFSVSSTLAANTVYVEDHQTPFDLCIEAENNLAQSQAYKLVSWELLEGRGHVLYQENNTYKAAYSGMKLKYGVNALFYSPEKGYDGLHQIKFKVATAAGVKEATSTVDFRVVDHRIEDFTAHLSSFTANEPILPFRKSRWNLHIHPQTPKGNNLTYTVKRFIMHAGEFKLDRRALVEGASLRPCDNELELDPQGHIGDLGLEMVVVNSKGDERTVTFGRLPIIQDPAFNVVGSINDHHICLKITSDNHHRLDEWKLLDYALQGGIQGNLSRLEGPVITNNTPLQVGDNYYSFQVQDIANVIGTPYLDARIAYPDSRAPIIVRVDLSIFLLEQLGPKLLAWQGQLPAMGKQIIEDYTQKPTQKLEEHKVWGTDWLAEGTRMQNIMVYMQDSVQSDIAREHAAVLSDMYSKGTKAMTKRLAVTDMLHDWTKESQRISNSKEPEQRTADTRDLKQEIQEFQSSWQGDSRQFEGMEDVVVSLTDLLAKINVIEVRTNDLGAAKSQRKTAATAELDGIKGRLSGQETNINTERVRIGVLNENFNAIGVPKLKRQAKFDQEYSAKKPEELNLFDFERNENSVDVERLEAKIRRGADVNQTDTNRQSVLMYAAILGRNDIVAVLLRNGANPSYENNDNLSAIHVTNDSALNEKNWEKFIKIMDCRRRILKSGIKEYRHTHTNNPIFKSMKNYDVVSKSRWGQRDLHLYSVLSLGPSPDGFNNTVNSNHWYALEVLLAYGGSPLSGMNSSPFRTVMGKRVIAYYTYYKNPGSAAGFELFKTITK